MSKRLKYFEKQYENKSQQLEAMTRITVFLREQEVFRAQLEEARVSASFDSERCQALEQDLVREKAARTQEKDELLSKMDDIRAQGSARLAEHESKASLQLSEAFDRIATLISQHGMSKELSEVQASSNAAQSRCNELEKKLQELKSKTSKE